MPGGRQLGDNILHANDLDALYENLFDAYLFESGGESVFNRDINTGNSGTHPSQRLILNGFRCKRTETISQMVVKSGTTAAGATPTLVRYGVYLRRPDLTNYDLVASTPNDTTLFAASNTAYPKAFSAPFTKIRGEEYLVGILIVTAAATPTFLAVLSAGNASQANDGIRLPVRAGIIGAQADLPATFTIATITPTTPVVGPQTFLLP